MSWIKDNKFAAMLGGATLLGALVLFYVGINFHGRYSKALETYLGAAEEVKTFEEIPLYPSVSNRQGKAKALNEYRTAITAMATAFDKFRPKDLKNIAPQSFADHAKTANEEATKAFEKTSTKLPDGFFLGFEPYTAGLAREDATGLLDYQLGATKELMIAFAKAAPSQLQNLYRPKFPEEDGEKFQAGPNDATRSFPMEVTFKGSERSVREFLSTIVNSPNYFFVVRTMRITNEKQVAPNVKDARFEAPPAAPGAAKPSADPFGGAGGFVIPSDEPAAPEPTPAPAAKPAGAKPTGATPAKLAIPGAVPARPAAVAPKPAAPKPVAPKPVAAPAAATAATAASDSSRILNRVLGSEELEVFLHIDVLEFFPIKALPEVPKSKP